MQIERLRVPASEEWISGRVGTLLVHYFVSAMPPQMMAKVAEDWIVQLEGSPEWAIEAACQWWLGAANPDVRKKPLPGEIAKLVRSELGKIRIAKMAVERFKDGPKDRLA